MKNSPIFHSLISASDYLVVVRSRPWSGGPTQIEIHELEGFNVGLPRGTVNGPGSNFSLQPVFNGGKTAQPGLSGHGLDVGFDYFEKFFAPEPIRALFANQENLRSTR